MPKFPKAIWSDEQEAVMFEGDPEAGHMPRVFKLDSTLRMVITIE